MYRSFLIASLGALLPLAASIAPAAAQGYPQGGSQNATVRCESQDQRQRVCRTNWRSAVMVRQLSRGDCIEGRSWGSSNGAVWVSSGCRAEFAEGRGGWGGNNGQGGWGNNGTIRCDSNKNRQQVCNTGWRRAVLVRQVSDTRCTEGRNWGSSNGSVWVSGGCRAEFAEARGNWAGGNGNNQGGWNNNGVVRCDSNNNRQQVCNTGWRRATLLRQISDTRCIEGRNWGSSNGSVWVSGGCRAEFTQGQGGWGGNGQGGWGGGNYVVDCHSNSNRLNTCNWDRRQGRPVIVQQVSDTRCVEGRNWGYNGNSIWVNGGCRARFGAR
ncbi:MAG: DUF3011 domain-containing protein [Stenotrophomonas sp.]